MPLYTSNATQLVASGDNVAFDNAPCHSLFAYHRRGGGSVLIFRPGIYQITFSANVTDTNASTDTSVSFAITENGNSISSATSAITVGNNTEIENLHAKTLLPYLVVLRFRWGTQPFHRQYYSNECVFDCGGDATCLTSFVKCSAKKSTKSSRRKT